MLYDTRWEKEIEPSLPGMIRWLEKQPGKRTYNYYSADKCVCGQYYDSLGVQFDVYEDAVSKFLNQRVGYSGKANFWSDVLWGLYAPDTMGEALVRARKALPAWALFKARQFKDELALCATRTQHTAKTVAIS